MKSPIAAAIAGSILTASLVGGVAIAQIAGPEVITACVHSQNGSVRVVGSVEECRAGENALAWNQQGPQGPQGPQGEPGEQGEPGPAGPSGISGYVTVQERVPFSPGAVVSLRVECPAGKKALSGGFDVEGDVPYNSVHAYRDNPTLTGTSWNIMVANENNWVERETLPGRLRGWAVCANVA